MRNVCSVALAVLLPASVFAQQPSQPAPTAGASTSQPAASKPASSQAASSSSKAFVAFHVGGQAADSSLVMPFTFSQYDETASVSTDQGYGAGFLFNVEGGYKVTDRIGVGLAISHTSGDATGAVTASIPHPQLFDQPRTATFNEPDAQHSETGIHIFGSYEFKAASNLGVRVFAGPTIFHASHDVVSAITFQEGSSPFTSVTITGATLDERKKTVAAFHVGAGATYQLTDRFGVDGFFRFARRTVDIDGVGGGTRELKVGGVHLGVGVRVGF